MGTNKNTGPFKIDRRQFLRHSSLAGLSLAGLPGITWAVEGDQLDPSVETEYRIPIDKHAPDTPAIARIDRFDFYDRAREAFCVVMTGETCKYGNILLKKGVTP